MRTLTSQDPLAVAVTEAIRVGDLPALRHLLAEHPGLAAVRVTGHGEDGKGTPSLLHIATDRPGHYPRGPEVIAALVAAGADPDARFGGAHEETPLHWTAGDNDVPVLDALIAAGADIEAPGAVIAGGTPARRHPRLRPVACRAPARRARRPHHPPGRRHARLAGPGPGLRPGR